MPIRVTLESCPSNLNPVLLVEADGLRAYYGVPSRAERVDAVIVHTSSLSVVEALRRLEPGPYTVYAAGSTTAARLATALGHRVVEVYGDESLGPLRLRSGACGLYAQAGTVLLTPPCDVARLYSELPRLWPNGYTRIVAAGYGEGVDAYLHRLGASLAKQVYLVECASQWLGAAGTALDVEVLRVGESLAG